MPLELTIIAVTALLAGLLLVGMMLAGRDSRPVPDRTGDAPPAMRVSPPRDAGAVEREHQAAQGTLRVVWWLTITIVLLGVGMSGSFAGDQAAIFLLGAGAVVGVVLFHELGAARRGRLVRLAELIAALALIGGLLALTGFASSPFAILFALIAVAAALAYGPTAGLAAAGLATVAYAVVLLSDPNLASYGPEDALRLSLGLIVTWLLAFVAVAYAAHLRRTMAHAITLSQTDPLTGLFNRSQLYVTLEREVSRTRRSDRGFCVLMIDLDGLKSINDSAGHLRGDDVLRAIGAIIHGSIRAVDSAYRFGGDEFVVLLPETDIVGAFVVAEKIRAGAEDVGATFGRADALTSVSIGLVSHPEDGLSAEELMTAADRAMYQAKRLGKNQISGNPRPRPPLLGRRPTPAADADEPSPPEAAPERQEPSAVGSRVNGVAPRDDRAVAVELGPMVVANGMPARMEGGDDDDQPDQADPLEVRRQIAAASRSFDPDHQVRRAMDAFFSPSSLPGDQERTTPDH